MHKQNTSMALGKQTFMFLVQCLPVLNWRKTIMYATGWTAKRDTWPVSGQPPGSIPGIFDGILPY